jgi:hypothetical protein
MKLGPFSEQRHHWHKKNKSLIKINPRIPLEKALYKYICKSSTLYLVDASPKKLTQELIVYWVQQNLKTYKITPDLNQTFMNVFCNDDTFCTMQ